MGRHAPLYTPRERVGLALKFIGVVIVLYLTAQFWFAPWLEAYLPGANCRSYGNLTGLALLLYGAFVGLPLALALLLLALEGPRSLRVWRIGQHPLPGEKVLRKTPYRYGRAARVRPLLLLLCVCIMLAAAVWGYLQARALIANVPPCEAAAVERDEPAAPGNSARETVRIADSGQTIRRSHPWQFTDATFAA